MTNYFHNIPYLENEDFDKVGNLIIKENKNRPILIMIQSSTCHYCIKAKSDFEKLFDKYKNKIFFATIQINGNKESEQNLMKRIPKFLPFFNGVPTFVLYDKNGKFIKYHQGYASFIELEKFIKNY